MSLGARANLMKWACSFSLAALLVIASFAVGQAQDKENVAATKYKVVRVPSNIVEIDYTSEGKARKPAIRPINPLDELAAEGWELVAVVHAEGAKIKASPNAEAYGGDIICFLRKHR